MKRRIVKTTMRIPASEDFYWIIEYKKHWWSSWKMINNFEKFMNCKVPLMFKSKEEALAYLEE